ncbi:hypothetical protein CES85_4979 [Ochrobactrum quorumnocens]|uniref:Tetratricopeptide repeat family protein n=1 Tax=Ochrobactrum quorumnocens TaxID=271865 RepID=A0A248UBL0_9HYPH|nr:hypothetical protein CES85_4979 [[Ochrobactrum] quorumnocens]
MSAQLDRILRSSAFSSSDKLRKFLSYVVIETIEGRGDRIKSYSIAIEVFHRHTDFDTSQDGIVRTTANRLRSALEKYYRLEGINDPVVISLPKGRYVPSFVEKPVHLETIAPGNEDFFDVSETAVSVADVNAVSSRSVVLHRKIRLWMAAVCFLTVIMIIAGTVLPYLRDQTRWLPPILIIQATTALTDDEPSKLFARSLPVRLSGALSHYDINSVTRALNSDEAHTGAVKFPPYQSIYVITSEVAADEFGLVIYWQLVDARTGAVLWSSTIPEKGDSRSLDILIHELVGEDALIRFFERRKLPTKPITGYVCVTHTLNKLTTITDADRAWMSRCLADTVAEQPDYAQAWALLARVRVEDSIAAADRGEIDISKAMLDDARRSYLNAQKLAPASWFTLHARIVVEFQMENFESFEALASQALLILPKNARERLVIGSRLFALGDYQQAQDVIQETIPWITYPQPSDHLFLAADLYRRGEMNKARLLLQGQRVPDSKLYWVLLASVACRLGDLTTAIAALKSLDDLSPDFSHMFEADLRNRHFRSDFIREIVTDLNKVQSSQ